MGSLIARTPGEGLLPVARGTVTLTEVEPEAITSVAALAGADMEAFADRAGAAFPAPGEVSGDAFWSGRGQCMILGAAPGDLAGMAVTDQSDAWGVLRLEGEGAADILARLCPVDLRPATMPPGRVARTLLSHMNCILVRRAPDAFDILVFRSMTPTAVHDLTVAMEAVAARR